MKMQKVEVARAIYNGWLSGDVGSALECLDPEIVWEAIPDAPDAGVYRGHEGVRAFWRDWLSAWSDLQFEIEDVVDGGEEIVLLVSSQRQWGRHSGIETEVPPYGMVFTVRDGKVVRVRAYADQESALEAAGLSE